MKNHPNNSAFPLFLLMLAALAFVYSEVTGFGILYHDDNLYITDNPLLNGGSFSDYFKSRYQANWIPITWLSYKFDQFLYLQWFGGYHITNVALHFLNGALIYLLGIKLSKSTFISISVSLLFLLHPVSVESVAWISSRKDLLATNFSLLAIYIYIGCWGKTLSSKKTLLIAGLFLLSIMSKQSWVGLPVILLSSLALYAPSKIIEHLKLLLITSAISCGAAGMAIWANSFASIEERVSVSYPLLERCYFSTVSLFEGLGSLIAPSQLSAFYSYPAAWESPSMLFIIGAVTALCIVTSFIIYRPHRKFIALMCLFYGMLWLPTSGIVSFNEALRADRFIYVAQIGLWSIIVYVLHLQADRIKKFSSFLLALSICLYAYKSSQRVKQWETTETLFTDAYKSDNNCYYSAYKLGYLAQLENNHELSMSYFQQCVDNNERFSKGWSALAVCYARNGDLKTAESHFKKALSIHTTLAEAWFNLGHIYRIQGQAQLSAESYQKAAQLDSKFRR